MLMQLLFQVLAWVAGFFTLALLGRVLLQWVRAPLHAFRNPLGQFVMTVTDWAVIPTRRVIPGIFGLDLASLLLAWLTQVIHQGLLLSVTSYSTAILPLAGVLSALLLALLVVLRLGIYLIMGVIIINVLFSWLNPAAPLAPLFKLLARPFLAPWQRLVPPLGGLDLSPLLLLLVLQLLLTVLASLPQALLPLLLWR